MSKQPDESIQHNGKRILSLLMVLFVLALGITIGTLISYHVGATGPAIASCRCKTTASRFAGGAFLALSQAFEEVANRNEPCVVNINTEELVTPGQDLDNPMNDILRRFGFNGPLDNTPQLRRSLGSGVIVDPKGLHHY